MYLTHNGVVRETARASVREGAQSAPVKGMRFSYARMASGMPRVSRSTTARVASGVTSRGEKPVPPVVSTRFTRFGERADTSGPALKALLEEAGWDVVHTAILPDELEQIKGALTACAGFFTAGEVHNQRPAPDACGGAGQAAPGGYAEAQAVKGAAASLTACFSYRLRPFRMISTRRSTASRSSRVSPPVWMTPNIL